MVWFSLGWFGWLVAVWLVGCRLVVWFVAVWFFIPLAFVLLGSLPFGCLVRFRLVGTLLFVLLVRWRSALAHDYCTLVSARSTLKFALDFPSCPSLALDSHTCPCLRSLNTHACSHPRHSNSISSPHTCLSIIPHNTLGPCTSPSALTSTLDSPSILTLNMHFDQHSHLQSTLIHTHTHTHTYIIIIYQIINCLRRYRRPQPTNQTNLN